MLWRFLADSRMVRNSAGLDSYAATGSEGQPGDGPGPKRGPAVSELLQEEHRYNHCHGKY